MRVLLTGASSFTGFWFAQALFRDGHEVVAPLRSDLASYVGIRAERVEGLSLVSEIVENVSFGSDRFLDIASSRGFDVFCHHAARVGDYRSPDFDVAGALADNTMNLRKVIEEMRARGLRAIVSTGSVFEQDEGLGQAPLVAFSPYGLSKGLTAQVIDFHCAQAGVPCGKFVIPNPFGPMEEPRFCAYLLRCWKAGDTAKVSTPDYIRDNIHVDLLARAYSRYVSDFFAGKAPTKFNPSGYVESQGRFAERLANAMRARSELACRVELATQTDFGEPLMRVNSTPASLYVPGWSESDAWDAIAQSYAV